jgi:hypothetical protein
MAITPLLNERRRDARRIVARRTCKIATSEGLQSDQREEERPPGTTNKRPILRRGCRRPELVDMALTPRLTSRLATRSDSAFGVPLSTHYDAGPLSFAARGLPQDQE